MVLFTLELAVILILFFVLNAGCTIELALTVT